MSNGYDNAALAGYYEPGPDPCETYPTHPEGLRIQSAADERHVALEARVKALEQRIEALYSDGLTAAYLLGVAETRDALKPLQIQIDALRQTQATCGCDCTRQLALLLARVETLERLVQIADWSALTAMPRTGPDAPEAQPHA